MISYLDQLKKKAAAHGIFLHQAFQKARINAGTYSRTRRGRTSLRWTTALRVSAAIDRIAAEKRKPKPRRLRIVQRDD